jgi:hypothetical protein
MAWLVAARNPGAGGDSSRQQWRVGRPMTGANGPNSIEGVVRRNVPNGQAYTKRRRPRCETSAPVTLRIVTAGAAATGERQSQPCHDGKVDAEATCVPTASLTVAVDMLD